MAGTTLQETILNEAKRDCFDGAGRIFISTFCKEHAITEKQLFEALKKSGLPFKVWENILIIYLVPKNMLRKIASKKRVINEDDGVIDEDEGVIEE